VIHSSAKSSKREFKNANAGSSGMIETFRPDSGPPARARLETCQYGRSPRRDHRYSVKLRGNLRYRRFLSDWIIRAPQFEADPLLSGILVPLLRFQARRPTILTRLQSRTGWRSAIRADVRSFRRSALAFLNSLFEDLADEWITKMMYPLPMVVCRQYRLLQILDSERPSSRG